MSTASAKLSFWISVAIILSSCVRRPDMVPPYKDMHTSPYGCYITLVCKPKNSLSNVYIQGELIAQEQNKLYVFTEKKKFKVEAQKLVMVEQKNIIRYKIMYAKDKMDITPFVVTPIVLTHGFFMLLTFPVNIISAVMLDASAANEFSYSEKQIKFKDLYLFARFPQGLPAGLTTEDL
jgi:hypothetical protein